MQNNIMEYDPTLKIPKSTNCKCILGMLILILITFSSIAGNDDLIFENSFEAIDLGMISYVTEAETIFDQAEAVLEVRATLADGALFDVLINGTPANFVTQDEDAAIYRLNVTLNEGDNLIEAVANYSDENGDREEVIEANFSYYDLPIITFTSPLDWQTLGPVDTTGLGAGGALNLSGVVERPVSITGTLSSPVIDLKINQQQASFTNNTFSFDDYFLHEGTNLISATATDEFGRQTTATITVYVDQTAPFVSVANTFERITSANFTTLNGTINDAVEGDFNAPEAMISVNNLITGQNYEAQVEGINYLSPQIALAVGNNPMLITASDQFGNTRQITTNITRVDAGTNRLSYMGGSNQSGLVGDQLSMPLRIAAFDKTGLPISDVTVHFDVIKGSGTISSLANDTDLIDGVNPARNLSLNTDASGEVHVWLTHGQESGLASHVVKAWSDDLSESIYFTTSSLVGEPARVVVEDGAGTQYAQTHSSPLHSPTVVVLDAMSNPVPGAQVRFSIRSGDAKFDDSSAINAQVSAGGLSVITTSDKKGQAAARPSLGSSTGVVLVEAQSINSSGNLVGSTDFQIIVKARNNGPTRFTGTVMDMSGIPLEGVILSFARSSLTTTTDKEGFFRFEGNVPVGRVDLFIDGRNVTMVQNGETVEYPGLHFEATVIQGQDNHLPHIIYLPPVHTDRAQVVGGDEDVSLFIPGFDGFEMIVKSNSVTFPDGSRTGELVVNPVHADRLPMVPPGGSGRFSPFGWTIQPSGTRFDPPIEVKMPNVSGMKPGTTRTIVQWDHDLAQFIPMGLGTVSADGTQIVTEPGSGITKAGWGGGPPPPPPTNEGENECSIGRSGDDCICTIVVSADNETDVLWKIAENDGTTVEFDAELEGNGCDERTFEWYINDGSSVLTDPPPFDHEFELPGTYLVTAFATCVNAGESCNPGKISDSIEVNIFLPKVEIKEAEEDPFELIGVNSNQYYAERTNLEIEVLYPDEHPEAGNVIDDFSGDAEITEEAGTAYYDGNDGASTLPETISIQSGKGDISIDSVSNTLSLEGPIDASIKIELSDFDNIHESSLETVDVDQWVEESDLETSDNIGDTNDSRVPDWLEKQSWDIVRSTRGGGGILGEVMAGVKNVYLGRTDGILAGACGYVPFNPRSIYIGLTCTVGVPSGDNGHRMNTNSTLTETVLHESRHTWQFRILYSEPAGATGSSPKQDSDDDGCPEIVADGTDAGPNDSTPIQDGVFPTTGDDSIDNNPGGQIPDNIYHTSPYPWAPSTRVDKCRYLIETDAVEFEDDYS
ncbi:PKD domain-containing protein [Marinicella marina]|uniref:PKD domain-containing protein n=1 Tax=Marinicella marina TaxID=2996016 RepID=UPI0024BC4371|nr:hypothetical protein [Marinicella marina]MDJ1138797.1 hypothetical protein [Marinicella marina]